MGSIVPGTGRFVVKTMRLRWRAARWGIAAVLACLTAGFTLPTAALATDPTPVLAPESVTPTQAAEWFTTKGTELAQSLKEYLPGTPSENADSRVVLDDAIQVYTWSNQYISGVFTADTALTGILMWAARASFEGNDVGVVTYTPYQKNLYPRPLPSNAKKLAPRSPTSATTSTSPSPSVESGITEPKNSNVAVKLEQAGAVYLLPEVARFLRELRTVTNARIPAKDMTSIKSPAANQQPLPVLVYDPVVDAWFAVSQGNVSALSNAAKARISGPVTLSAMCEAVQSWWGVSEATPTPTPEVSDDATSGGLLWGLIGAAILVAGVSLAVAWLSSRAHNQGESQVQPLPDNELIIVPPPPKTSAIPTLDVER